MKMKLYFLCCLLSLLLVGCEFEFVSPDSLIQAPASNQEKLQQKQLITSFLGREENLIVPKGMDNNNAYQFIDLDRDGEDEIIAFYANKENNFMLGFLILDQSDGQWFLSHKAIAYGTDIHYFSVKDLDDDGNMELLLGVRTGYGSLKELYLYQLKQGEMQEVTSGDRITYDEITLAKNVDNKNVIVTAHTDTTVLVGSSNIVVYEYEQDGIYSVYDETFDGYCSEMRFDKVSKDQYGVYLAMRHNHFVNVLLLKETEEGFAMLLEQTLPYDYEDMSSMDLFRDENGDGILEVCSLWEPENNNTTKTYQDYIQVWLQWDGQEGMKAVDAVLENRAEGYRFYVPLEWMDSLYYDFRTEGTLSWVDFYYETGTFAFETVFSIAAVDQLTWDTMKLKEDMVMLGNNPINNKIYIADVQNQQFNGFQVDASRLISCLQIEGGERK